ncbi:ATP-binding protein [Streptomyces sp. DSM 118878]
MTPPAHATSQPTDTAFELRFTSTPRGARLARRLTGYCLDHWGCPYDSEVNEHASLVVAELASNAVTHGRVPGRDVLLRLSRGDGRLRIEVSDSRDESHPVFRSALEGEEAGRGLLIVGALTETWGVTPRTGAPGRTVWAVLRASGPGYSF